MHVLRTGSNCVAEYNFPLTMFEKDNKGLLFIYDPLLGNCILPED